MLKRVGCSALALGLICMLSAASVATASSARTIRIGELKPSAANMSALRADWVDQIRAKYSDGTWAPAKMTLGDRDLALMGLPPKRVLLAHRYPVPTAFYPSGKMVRLATGKRAKGGGSGGSGGSTA